MHVEGLWVGTLGIEFYATLVAGDDMVRVEAADGWTRLYSRDDAENFIAKRIWQRPLEP